MASLEAADVLRQAEERSQLIKRDIENEGALQNSWGKMQAQAGERLKRIEDFMKVVHIYNSSKLSSASQPLCFLTQP